MFLLKRIRTDLTFKGAYGQSLPTIIYFNQINPKNLQHTMTKETFVTIPIVVFLKKDFYLLNALNNQIMNLISAGMIDLWYRQDIDQRKLKARMSKRPKVLTMSRLFGCFQILLCGFTMSFFVFLMELVYVKLSSGSINPFLH